jgi:uncharacterized membrane protein YgcG
VLVEWSEWRVHSLRLLTVISRELGSLAFAHAELLLVPYFELATRHVQLQLLLGSVLAGSDPRGRLAAAAYNHAHRTLGLTPPPDWPAAAAAATELASPVPSLQADFANVGLRVADALVPLAPHMLSLADSATLQDEAILSPLAAAGGASGGALGGGGGGGCGGGGGGAYRGGGCSDGGGGSTTGAECGVLPGLGVPFPPVSCDPARLLPYAWRSHQWAIYGFLACPAELASPGAPELLLGVLRCSQALDIAGELKIYPHAYFEFDPKTAARWLAAARAPSFPPKHAPRPAGAAPAAPPPPVSSAGGDPKRFVAEVREARAVAARVAPAARASARAALTFKLTALAAHARVAGGMAGGRREACGGGGADTATSACAVSDGASSGGAISGVATSGGAILGGGPSALTLFPLVISALRLAQAELEWWATHADATPDEVRAALLVSSFGGMAQAEQIRENVRGTRGRAPLPLPLQCPRTTRPPLTCPLQPLPPHTQQTSPTSPLCPHAPP